MIVKVLDRIKKNEVLYIVLRGTLMGIMLILIFLYLINTDLTSAPEYVYNQF